MLKYKTMIKCEECYTNHARYVVEKNHNEWHLCAECVKGKGGIVKDLNFDIWATQESFE